MAFMSRFSRSRSSSRSPNRKDAERASPNLTVSELERLLYTGKTACNHADEVWPRLYIGDQWVFFFYITLRTVDERQWYWKNVPLMYHRWARSEAPLSVIVSSHTNPASIKKGIGVTVETLCHTDCKNHNRWHAGETIKIILYVFISIHQNCVKIRVEQVVFAELWEICHKRELETPDCFFYWHFYHMDIPSAQMDGI